MLIRVILAWGKDANSALKSFCLWSRTEEEAIELMSQATTSLPDWIAINS